ncbi:hypothetical protein AB4175_12655 [Vibrio cyclitrophicus]
MSANALYTDLSGYYDLMCVDIDYQAQDDFTFRSGWYYSGEGDKQALKLSIEKTTAGETQIWNDEHPMVAFNFKALFEILKPYFEVHTFEHDYDKLLPWDLISGNALITCVKA